MLSSAVWFVDFSRSLVFFVTKSLKAVADPLTKASAVWLMEFSCAMLPSP